MNTDLPVETEPGLTRCQAVLADAIGLELGWLEDMITTAMHLHFQNAAAPQERTLHPPVLPAASAYARAILRWELDATERLILALALAPHVRPHALDAFLIRNTQLDLHFTQFGGISGTSQRGFWPSAETAAFVIAGESLPHRLKVHGLFAADARLFRLGILEPHVAPGADMSATSDAAPAQSLRSEMGMALQMSAQALSILTRGHDRLPVSGADFPARLLTTPLDWSALVLAPHVLEEAEEIRSWILHQHTLMHDWGLSRHLKPGFRALFYGPPGTGKTLTATLMGKVTGCDVYRVDLSLIVSKYIGETEKNLARLFDRAEQQRWILFFDEADALFGKRSGGSSANDRHANQEIAYLLQRVESFPGVVILASNLKANIDEAFARRFQLTLYFPMPGPAERLRLWQDAFSAPLKLAADCDFETLARQYELSGGAIINVLRFAALCAVRREQSQVALADIRQGIRRELRKEGKVDV